jgi:ketosteroid isomerase-like protein
MVDGNTLAIATLVAVGLCASGRTQAAPEAAPHEDKENAARTILAMERAALDRWVKGDPDGFLEISDPEVVYFDPYQPRRVNGIAELRRLYDSLRGQAKILHYEIIDPKVTVLGDMAVLTFNFVSQGSEGLWNTTEVYRRNQGQWRIIHTHWSLTGPKVQK